LSPDKVEAVFKKLKRWLGPFRLAFTGAEPLIHPEILEIVKIGSQLDIYTIMVSNGQVITERKAEEIITSGLNVLNISLDGYRPETHDYIRGVPGTYRRATQALDRVLEARKKQGGSPVLYVNTIVMKRNLDELADLVKWTAEKGYDGIHFQALESKHVFGGMESYNPEWFTKDPLWPSQQPRVAKTITALQKLQHQGYPIKSSRKEMEDFKAYFKNPIAFARKYKFCYTGVNNFSIAVNGDVHLCFSMKPVGNVLEQDPKKIWYGLQAKMRRQAIRQCQRSCRILACNKRYELGQVTSAFTRNVKQLFFQRD